LIFCVKFRRYQIEIRALLSTSLALIFAGYIPSSAATIDWQPTTINWACAVQPNNEQLCSLSVSGNEPAGITGSPQASGKYRIHKGSVAAQGAVLATIPFTIDCTRIAPNTLTCVGNNLLRLGAGVTPTIDNSLRTTAFSISHFDPSLLFDWNEDGLQTGAAEGMIALRYLAGFRGNSLVEGITLSAGVNAATIEQAANLGELNEWYRFGDAANGATGSGVIFLRCMLGLRGVALAAGVTNASSLIDDKCAQLTARQ
jgi:hypothetical protein